MKEFLKDTLNRQVIFVTGKGGVGKSTLAWATAQLLFRQNRRVLLAYWDSLFDESKKEPETIEGIKLLRLDTLSAFREYALQFLKFEKLYEAVFENRVLRTFLLAAPGLAEAVVAGKIWYVHETGDYDHIVVDLPSTGHALSFFSSPLGVQKMFSTGFVHRDAERVLELFTSQNCRIDLVCRPEELPLTECRELKTKLSLLHRFPFGFLHFNSCVPQFDFPGAEMIRSLPDDTQSLVGKIRERFNEQKSIIASSADLELETVCIPRLPNMSRADRIQKISEQLENH